MVNTGFQEVYFLPTTIAGFFRMKTGDILARSMYSATPLRLFDSRGRLKDDQGGLRVITHPEEEGENYCSCIFPFPNEGENFIAAGCFQGFPGMALFDSSYRLVDNAWPIDLLRRTLGREMHIMVTDICHLNDGNLAVIVSLSGTKYCCFVINLQGRIISEIPNRNKLIVLPGGNAVCAKISQPDYVLDYDILGNGSDELQRRILEFKGMVYGKKKEEEFIFFRSSEIMPDGSFMLFGPFDGVIIDDERQGTPGVLKIWPDFTIDKSFYCAGEWKNDLRPLYTDGRLLDRSLPGGEMIFEYHGKIYFTDKEGVIDKYKSNLLTRVHPLEGHGNHPWSKEKGIGHAIYLPETNSVLASERFSYDGGQRMVAFSRISLYQL